MRPATIAFKLLTGTLMIVAASAMAGEQGREHRGPPPEVKAAFQACFAEIGVTVNPGERPDLSTDQQAQLASCLDGKGVSRPPRDGERHGRGGKEGFEKMKACLSDLGVTMPEHVPGQRPELNDEQRAAMQTCHEKLKSEREQTGSVDKAAATSGVSSSAE
ncbi:MAG: hypothetical protein ACXVBE_13065 [Bdellovibrionota bacterium]